MKHITRHIEDVPVIPFLMDRRRTPDRRLEWRGGRRDSDWHNRPAGAWERVAAAERQPVRLARLFSVLHIW